MIATVVLVATAITVAIAVAFWMGGIAGQYTSFEKLEVSSKYAVFYDEVAPVEDYWLISVVAKNTGAQDSTLTYILLNERPLSEWTGVTWEDDTGTPIPADGLPIPSGAEPPFQIRIMQSGASASGLTHGVTVKVNLHSAAGMDYPFHVQLP